MHWEKRQFYQFGPFRLDPEERVLMRNGAPIPLRPKVTDTLCLLVENAGHVVDKDQILKHVWPDAFVEEGNINKHIFILRKTLGPWDDGREYIETVSKRGYRFIAAVNEVVEEGAGSSKVPAASGQELPDGFGGCLTHKTRLNCAPDRSCVCCDRLAATLAAATQRRSTCHSFAGCAAPGKPLW